MPVLSILLNDIVKINEAETFLEETPDLINLGKMRDIADVLELVKSVQKIAYDDTSCSIQTITVLSQLSK